MSYPFRNLRLGKKDAVVDPRTYRLEAPLANKLVDVPRAIDWSLGIKYDMNGNDVFGDCAFAAMSALILTWTSRAQAPIRLSRNQTLLNYAQATGFNILSGANDNGTVLLDALNIWRKDGFVRPGQPGKDFLTAFGAINPKDRLSLKRAVVALGGVYAGIQVPRYLMTLGGDWAYDPSQSFVSIGGHCIAIVGYDDFGWKIFTWGGIRRMAYDLWDAIADEAYGLLSFQNWMGVEGVSPNREDLQTLRAELVAV